MALPLVFGEYDFEDRKRSEALGESLIAPRIGSINSLGLFQVEADLDFVDPFTGEVSTYTRKKPQGVELEFILKGNSASGKISPYLFKSWWLNKDNAGFTQSAVVSTSDSKLHNYYVYEGPDSHLKDKLFVMEENTKGKYAFLKEVDSEELYYIDKKYLVKPPISWIGPSDSKSHNQRSGGAYRNKHGELISRKIKVLRDKRPLDPSGLYSPGQQISVVKTKKNWGIDKIDNRRGV